MLIAFLRILILYPVVVFGIRLMGKRQIGQLQPTELVITLLISNIAALPLEDPNLPLLMGIVPMMILICCEVLLSWGVLKHTGLRRLLSGTPQMIIRNGTIDQQAMESLRFTTDDLMTALRENGIFDVSEVQLAVVETNGQVSIYQKAAARPVTAGDLQVAGADEDPPALVVADGCIREEGLQHAGLTQKKLQAMLKQKKTAVQDVFLLTADKQGIRCLVRKENCP